MNIQTFFNMDNRSRKGFTLIELLVGISIIAILATIGFSTYSQSQLRGRDFKRKQDLRSIATGLELFFQAHRRYPCGFAEWQNSTSSDNWLVDRTTGGSTPPSGCPGTNISFAPTFINQLPVDPVNDTTSRYGYWQGDCTSGSHFALTAVLENPNDPDTIRDRVLNWCGDGTPQLSDGEGGSEANWSLNTFLIASW